MFQKFIDFFIFKNAKSGQKSYTTTLVICGFFIINLKLLFSGVSVGKYFTCSQFSGTDYAAALAAIGAIHIGNKKVNSTINKSESPSKDGDNI